VARKRRTNINVKREIELELNPDQTHRLLGNNDENLKLLRAEFNIRLVVRGDSLIIEGEEEAVDKVENIIDRLIQNIEEGAKKIDRELALQLEMSQTAPTADIRIERGKVAPKTDGQREYVSAVRRSGLTFAVGPAGTGKTFLATACAVEALRKGQVERLILTRPAVEAGENLGFLPGDMREKVDPYLRPVYDALGDMVGRRQLEHYIDTGIIEVAPLAFMRGRTLNKSFIILDEAQNTTPVQMKMFLTRIGENSRCVVTGDITQVDISSKTECGLLNAVRVLKDIHGVSIINLDKNDIVRHPLVAAIVKAYENESL